MTSVRRALATLVSVLMLATGLALVPAALVSPSSAEGGEFSCSIPKLTYQYRKAQERTDRADRVVADRRASVGRAAARYDRTPTRANRRILVRSQKRLDAAVKARQKAARQEEQARKRLKRCQDARG